MNKNIYASACVFKHDHGGITSTLLLNSQFAYDCKFWCLFSPYIIIYLYPACFMPRPAKTGSLIA